MKVKRGDIFYADLSPVVGSEQGGVRPVVVVQNDVGNKYSPTVVIAAITSQINKAKLPTHVAIERSKYGLPKNSVILAEQIRTIDKKRLREKVGSFDDRVLIKLDEALKYLWVYNLNYIFYKKVIKFDLVAFFVYNLSYGKLRYF